MSIYLDSAMPAEIKDAQNYPFLAGVTTNPKLISKALGKSRITQGEFLQHIKNLRDIVPGDLFVQTNCIETKPIVEEAKKIYEITGNTGVIKIPATLPGLQSIRILGDEGIRTACTAVFTGVQAFLAMSCGAEFVIPYYSRMDWSMHGGMEVIEHILEIMDNQFFDCKLLVASVKNPFDVLELLRAGVHGVTIPIELIGELIVNSDTLDAVNEFNNSLEIT